MGDISKAVAAGSSFTGCMVGGLLLGYWLDQMLGTRIWLTVIFSLLGFFAGILAVWRFLSGTPQKK
jgi:F0F1-type ATP synthase assembly protein I